MSRNDMTPWNWPLGPHNTTGLGLVWSGTQLERKFGPDGAARAREHPESLALLKLADLHAPAETLLLTEWGRDDNQVGGSKCATVDKWETQRDFIAQHRAQSHAGRFNYLMVDGHVELLEPIETGIAGAAGGLWTIVAGD